MCRGDRPTFNSDIIVYQSYLHFRNFLQVSFFRSEISSKFPIYKFIDFVHPIPTGGRVKAEETLDGGGGDTPDQPDAAVFKDLHGGLSLNLLGAVTFSRLLPATSPSQSSASSARYDYIL
jgi:hypothetical protein